MSERRSFRHGSAGALLAFSLAVGCATPSAELVEARKVYKTASQGIANELVPARVLEARQALELAEKAHDEDDGSVEERDLAYIASRKAMIAIADGRRAQFERDVKKVEKEYVETQGSMLKEARYEVGSMRDRLENQRRQLGEERQARKRAELDKAEVEKQLTVAMLSLREIASVKEEARGTVITLDGAVLFASGKAALLPNARAKLERVAEALKNQGASKRFIIEGHTDSRGSAQRNRLLSRRRAEAVRATLVELGVPAAVLRAVGKGASQPVASNASADGRANNRRVEIVVSEG